MLDKHKNVFFDAAQSCACWIGLREPNELADKWIGRPGYRAKGKECKAKTADNAGHRFGGLVVDPTKCSEAFRRETLHKAIETWQKHFLVGGRLPAGFTVTENGPERGLVKQAGASLHADYDLMTLIQSNSNGEFLPTSNADEEQLYAVVEPKLNAGFGVRLIQHGSEFMWDKGVGAREFEFVWWFGPGRRFQRLPSSMPKPGH